MAKPPRLAMDSNCFIAWADRKETEDANVLQAIDVTMERMSLGSVRVVASQAIEIEVRLNSVEETKDFHDQLKACPNFESFGESPVVRNLAKELQDRLQSSGRKGKYADLVHVATAIAARAAELWTTDKKLVNWYEQGTVTEVKICRPYLSQGVLPLD